MALYPNTVSDRTEPPGEPERTPFEWMEGCAHRDACQRIYELFIDPTAHFGWMDDMARILRCHDCECWED